MSKIERSIDVVLFVNDIAVGGQTNATLQRSMSPIDITNKITGSWKESLAGLKEWKVSCSGFYVSNQEGFKLLEEAFMENKTIEVKLKVNEIIYKGKALIINFPLNAVYNSQFKYQISLFGDGALVKD